MITAEETRNAWNDLAAGYDEFVTPSGEWGLPKEALHRAGLQSGMRFLDVACGSGALSIPAARLGAHVVAVDLSPAMIERLHARARREGLSNVEGYVMDGHNLELENNTFDIAGSQFGVMLFPDLPRGLRELVRVTRPGGRVMIVAYGPPAHVEFLQLFMGAMQAVVPGFTGLPSDPPPLPFQVADPEVLHQRMTEAGLKDIHVEAASEDLAFHSGKEMWDWVTNSNPIPRMLIADLTDEQKIDIQQVLHGMLREHANGQPGAVLNNLVHIGIGTK